MAWTTMHFAVGMSCFGAASLTYCFIRQKGWRWIPAMMTVGGIWAFIPDMPRIFREDFPSLPFAATLGDKALERTLHRWGDLFCFHRSLDAQPHEYALAGLAIILSLYNLSIALLMYLEHRQRNSIANRAWKSHAPVWQFMKHAREDGSTSDTHVTLPQDDADARSGVIARIHDQRFTKSG